MSFEIETIRARRVGRRLWRASLGVALSARSLAACTALFDTSDLGSSGALDASLADAASRPDAPTTPGDAAPSDARAPDAGAARCPQGRGSPMVDVGAFCIDAFEATVTDYAELLTFVAANGPIKNTAACAYKITHEPPEWAMQIATPNHPVTRVDWCDADAYCSWRGKRLCANRSATSTDAGASLDASSASSEWVYACTMGGMRAHPYGDAYVPRRCNFGDSIAPALRVAEDVGSFGFCEGGYSGLFDMTGNAVEWTASCNGQAGPTDLCLTRGGGFQDTTGSCASVRWRNRNETFVSASGIRCCADPTAF